MTYASVCSGIEAATVAWKPLDWSCAFTAEIEPFPCAVLKHHYPETPNYGDITKYQEWPKQSIDVLIGGTPCQSFSVAGLRKGLLDPRGNLALTFLGIVERFAPRWFVWENVPGVLSSENGRDFGAFLGGVAELGYGFAYAVLDAQYFGLAQRRKRVFVVGHSGGQWQRAAAVLFDAESMSWNPAPRRETREGTAHSLAPCIGASGRGFERTGDRRGQDAVIPIQEIGKRQSGTAMNGVGHGEPGDPMFTLQKSCEHGVAVGFNWQNTDCSTTLDGSTTPAVAHSLKADGFDASEDGTGRGTPLLPIAFERRMVRTTGGQPSEDLQPTLRADENSGDGAPCVAFAQNTRDEVRELGGNIAGALANQPGMKQQTYAKLNMAVRRLTPRECERLQGFPDNYTLVPFRSKTACDGPRYRALGNSMAVPVIRWIGQRIEMVDGL